MFTHIHVLGQVKGLRTASFLLTFLGIEPTSQQYFFVYHKTNSFVFKVFYYSLHINYITEAYNLINIDRQKRYLGGYAYGLFNAVDIK